MKRSNIIEFIVILVILFFCLWAILDNGALGRNGFTLGLDLKGGSHLVYQADLTKKDPSQTDAQVMAGVVQKIQRRVNGYGVTEANVQQQGTDRVVVDLPGVKNIDEAIKLIGQTAELEFKEEVLDDNGSPVLDSQGNPTWTPASAVGSDGVTVENLTGKYFKPNAQVVLNQSTSAPEVSFEFNSEGAVLFKQITTRLLNKPLGIFLDNLLVSAPTVNAVISDKGIIEGVSLQEAKTLAIQLNSGALDVPLSVLQQADVDASLGADSLSKSLLAGGIGIALVVLFMLIYYRVPGLMAIFALGIYAAMSLTVFKLIPITLTLPGIAGFIISIGMAVDANILISERMKEELRAKRSLEKAVEEGFRRAWPSIWMSNLSTIITCVILYWFGSTFGAFMVQGFAVTLAIGVLISMLSSVLISRTFLRMLVGSGSVKSLSAYGSHLNVDVPQEGSTGEQKKFKLPNLVKSRYLYFIISGIIIVPGIISLAIFKLQPGVDFSSGTSMTLQFQPPVEESQLRQSLADMGYTDAIIQKDLSSGNYLVRTALIPTDQRATVLSNLQTSLSDNVTILDYNTVSPSVASQTVVSALWAIVVASVFILLFIAFAFRKMKKSYRWGTCAVIALIHDVLVVTGIFSILGVVAGVQIDAMFITGMLTVVGYSVHDTIVVFDRIRENSLKYPTQPLEETVNFSIWQTLGRSLTTTLMVLFIIVAVFLLGGATIHYFMLILLIGIVTGTYSSVCNASQLLIVWETGKLKG